MSHPSPTSLRQTIGEESKHLVKTANAEKEKQRIEKRVTATWAVVSDGLHGAVVLDGLHGAVVLDGLHGAIVLDGLHGAVHCDKSIWRPGNIPFYSWEHYQL